MSLLLATRRYHLSPLELKMIHLSFGTLKGRRWLESLCAPQLIDLLQVVSENTAKDYPPITCDQLIVLIQSTDDLWNLLVQIWLAAHDKAAIFNIGNWFLEAIKLDQ